MNWRPNSAPIRRRQVFIVQEGEVGNINQESPLTFSYERDTLLASGERRQAAMGWRGHAGHLDRWYTARALHANSSRRDGPFVPVDCAALPSNLLESELLGHEKGAFTGAHQAKRGLLEQAHGGTLFLDEIGELSLELQAKLLRTLQERAFRHVGGDRIINVDILIISSTNRDLNLQIQREKFRRDLLFRLNIQKPAGCQTAW